MPNKSRDITAGQDRNGLATKKGDKFNSITKEITKSMTVDLQRLVQSQVQLLGRRTAILVTSRL